MDAVELLMVEHSGIRIIAEHNILQKSSSELIDFNKFLLNIHVNIEETVVFPLIEANDNTTAKLINSFISDHKLIEKLFSNLSKWKLSEDPLFEKRLPLFYKTLTEHNSNEENLLFPQWKNMDQEQQNTAVKNAHEIILSSDIENYVKETGISKKMMDYIFI
jgi:hemerythrin superfamily protein